MKMKLLQWVHHKFQPLKDLSIGNACICLSAQTSVDDQDSHMKTSLGSRYGCTSLEPPKRDRENTFSESEATEQEDTSAIISDLFHGFLTIGTLGSEPSINEPSTPTFAMTLENLTEEKGEVTENDLKLISYELEKFLTKEEGVRASSARNSHVSIITLGDKQMEESEDDEYWTTEMCPLKGYLFKASINLPETGIEAKKEKASLQELFDKTKITTANCKEKSETEEIKTNNKHNSATQFMKKMMKKLHASSKSSAPSIGGGDAADPVSIKKKLGEASDIVSLKKKPHKVLRIFHRKIHPENSIAAKELSKSKKYKDNKELSKSKKYKDNNSDAGGGGNDKSRFPQGARVKERTENCKKCLNLPQYRLSGTNFSRNGEHWIRTDADYLVLEL